MAKFEDDAGTANSGFDPNGNLLNLRYEKNNVLIRRFEWTYDDSNNRQSQLEFVPATQTEPSKAIKWEYGFDWFDRLVSVRRAEATTVAGLPTVPLKNLDPTYLQREYVFDESDNRKYFDDHVNGKTYHYKYKSIDDNGTIRYSDQLEEILTSNSAGDRVMANFTSLETFEHDADGNMTKRIKTGEEITFQWSDYDRLLRVESDQTGRKQDNRYDFNGIRKRKLDKNGNSSREYTASISTSSSRADLGSTSVPTISYLTVGGAIVGYEEDDGTTSEFRFFLTDALSSVRDIVDDTGTVVRSYEFDENGIEISSSGSGTDSAKTWIGGLSVNDDRADSGLFLMGHRHYAPELGRFISRDPIGFAGGLNQYEYGASNPINNVDPEGLEPYGYGNTGYTYGPARSSGSSYGSGYPIYKAPSFAEGPKAKVSIDLIEQLGYPSEANILRETHRHSLSELVPWADRQSGFTNPITGSIGIRESHCTDESPYDNLVDRTSIFFHEARHRGKMHNLSDTLDHLGQGVKAHWLGDGKAMRELELPIYQDELNFLNQWVKRSSSGKMTKAINTRRKWLRGHIKSIKNM